MALPGGARKRNGWNIYIHGPAGTGYFKTMEDAAKKFSWTPEYLARRKRSYRPSHKKYNKITKALSHPLTG